MEKVYSYSSRTRKFEEHLVESEHTDQYGWTTFKCTDGFIAALKDGNPVKPSARTTGALVKWLIQNGDLFV